ncbi:MAG: type II toxin-antitoxin system VapC family toxin [Chloroflexi bacterium]|nr:type II toxin-antitoxin system VapC family toxin [Chloroflexota bacterium]
MATKVADASVIAALAFEEPAANEAEKLVDGADIWAPTLLAYELTSTAWKKARVHPQKSAAIGQQLLKALWLDIHWAEVDHSAVFRLAIETGLSTYDASYLHLARSLGVPLVTFDQQLQSVLQARGD